MRLRAFLAVSWLLASLAAAQDHHTGYAFAAGPTNPVSVGILTPAGSVLTLVPTTALPSMLTLYRGCMDYDNRGHVLAYRDIMSGGGILRRDVTGRLTTLRVFPMPLFAPIPGGVMVDQDGDYTLAMDSFPAAGGGLFKVNRVTGGFTTLFNSPAFTGSRAMTRDLETGDYLLVSGLQSTIHRIDPLARTITSIASFGSSLPFAFPDIAQDPQSGALFVTQFMRGLYVVTAGGKTTLFLSGLPYSATVPLVMDRTSSRNPRLVAYARGSPPVGNLIYTVAINASRFTVVSTHAALHNVFDIWVDRGRNIATILRGVRHWEVALSFPGHGGLGYVVALSLSGTRPGFLVGGRRVPLNPDGLTTLSTQNRMAPWVTHTVGALDANGRGTAWIRVRDLPPLKGRRLHLVALVIDPKAPRSIRTISDPVMMRIP